MTEKDILKKIQRYNYIKAIKKELEEQLKSIAPKTTASYGEAAGGTPSGNTSKVERMAIRRVELERKIRCKKKELGEIEKLIEGSGLDQTEKEILWQIAKEESLRSYARTNNICKSYVYKIRDRALKKIAAKLQNV